MRKKLPRYKLSIWGAVFTYMGFLAFFSVIGDRGLWASYRLWRECQRIDADIDRLSRETNHLNRQVDLFRSDQRAIERFAREELHLAGRNEIHYIFE